jgi:hypothetical protein
MKKGLHPELYINSVIDFTCGRVSPARVRTQIVQDNSMICW